ncbi:MAG TPA: chloride channel protein [Vicinamibacteria bacterium]|jgi:H+/Cl- antiporter ClcA
MKATTPERSPLHLSDFSIDRRVIAVSAIAVGIGALAAGAAALLLKLIDLFTNLFFFLRLSTEHVTPAQHQLGVWAVLVPVAGALVIGFMARFGSDRIRGHGIPEALESILLNGSKVEPKLAILKPSSAAISIGSGGPFGAEGPIIMTGGALGSLVAQFVHLTAAERKTLLVAGAAAGMSATFAAPVASVALAVELLLFELKPRSFVPVALASAVALVARVALLGPGPVFATPHHAAVTDLRTVGACAALGLAAGSISALMTKSVYFWEDRFQSLRLHWMWWPALGAIAVGLGGLLEPRALGVGYDVIGDFLQGMMPTGEILSLVVVKWAIWSIALGSGTSGGVLAPLLIVGSGLGGVADAVLPYEGAGFWPLISMGAILGAMMRAPLTGIVFAVELTHDYGALLPLLVACAVAHGFSSLVMKRSILTEKIARRGYHLTREYQVDPLEVLFVRDVMRSAPAIPADSVPSQVAALLAGKGGSRERLYAVVDPEGKLVGVATRVNLELWSRDGHESSIASLAVEPVVAYADESLREIAYRMAETRRTRLPVVDREDPRKLLGLVTLRLLLSARLRHLEDEKRRERVFTAGFMVPRSLRRS